MQNEDGRPPCERFMPIEANEALKQSWRTRDPRLPSIPMEHRLTLNELLSAYHYDSEKERLFGIHRPEQLLYSFTDELLDVAITEMQEEGVTVVGLMFRIIQHALEMYPPLRKQMFGPVLHHSRSSMEIRGEMNIVSATLARLQKELNAALASESKATADAAKSIVSEPGYDALDEDHLSIGSLAANANVVVPLKKADHEE